MTIHAGIEALEGRLASSADHVEALVRRIEARVQSAHERFAAESTPREQEAVHALLAELHQRAERGVAGERVSTRGIEFAHGAHPLGLTEPGAAPLARHKPWFPTRLDPDGQLFGFSKWELLDPDWSEALACWLVHLHHRAKFNDEPVTLTLPNRVKLGIAGDFGTGPWRLSAPSTKVARAMAAQGTDYTIHLGDVYYAGSAAESAKNLVDAWPFGARGAFTLNSNHEMYSGALPYFGATLRHFELQRGCSYFALTNDHWLVIGLDTAFDADPFNLYLDGKLGGRQLEWLSQLPKDKRTLVLSHHEGLDAKGSQPSKLYAQVVQALGRAPDYWYWGHLHDAIVYREREGMRGRCIGHGAIPYGTASELHGEAQVEWYETELAADPALPLRVKNGFAVVNLDGPELTEALIGEDGGTRWSSL